MSQPSDSGSLLAWLVGGTTIATALIALARRIFNTVTRSELTRIMKGQDDKFLEALEVQREAFERALEREEEQRKDQHRENQGTARQTFDRLVAVEKGVSRIEGQLQERFGRSRPQ